MTNKYILSFAMLVACAGSASAQTAGFAVATSDLDDSAMLTGTTTGVLGEMFLAVSPDGGTSGVVTLDLPSFARNGHLTDTLESVSSAAGSASVAPYQDGDYFEIDFVVDLSGLTPGKKYDVVAYSSGQPTSFTFSGSAGTESLTSNTDTYGLASTSDEKSGVNYIESLEIADAKGDISFTASPGGSDPSFGVLDGVGVSPATAVPEPSTWALLIIGLALLGMRARRLRSGA